MSNKNRIHTGKFKFKVALEALKGRKTIPELCQEFEIASSQIYAWKDKLQESGPEAFKAKNKQKNENEDIDKLHAIIGKLKVENDFLLKALGN